MLPDQNESVPVPEWIVTYGDMMSLLLAFFIMAFAIGDVASSDKFRTMIETIRQRFEPQFQTAQVPAELKPRDSVLAQLIAAGRVERTRSLTDRPISTADKVKESASQTFAGRERTAIQIQFHSTTTELDDTAKSKLRQFMRSLGNEPKSVEVRGFLSETSRLTTFEVQQEFTLAFGRCQSTIQFLTEDLRFSQDRFYVAVAEPHATLANQRSTIGKATIELALRTEN